MKIEALNIPKQNEVEVGDLIVFLNPSEDNIVNVYIICFDKDEQWYYVQNVNGTKTKVRGYYTIDGLLEKRKHYRIIKANKAKLEFDLKDGFTYA